MPIYKISRRSKADQRARAAFVRTRLLALLLTAILIVGTLVLFLYRSHFGTL